MYFGVTTMSKKSPLLKVVFDTSVLYTEWASELLCHAAKELVKHNSDHQDLIIKWILPAVVVSERQYQMTKAAANKLPAMRDLERLLPISIDVNEKNLSALVETTTSTQIQELNVDVEELSTQSIDWKKLVHASLFREPPFGPSDAEKGFRDCLVLETFLQILKASPSTPSVCRVVLVARDERLRLAATARVKSKGNARVVETLEELEQLINTLVADVTEEFVQKIRDKAAECFFNSETKEGLYYKEDVKDRISSKFSNDLTDVPEGADVTRVDSWTIGKPQFLKKEGQRVSWNTRITAHRKALKRYLRSEAYYPPMTPSQLISGSTSGAADDRDILSPTMRSLRYPDVVVGPIKAGDLVVQPGIFPAVLSPATYKEKLVSEGETKFDVHWSVSVSTKQLSLSRGSIDELLSDTTTWHYRAATAKLDKWSI